MYITSAARLRFDTTYNNNNLRIEQNRRMNNNSWSMTLPFDIQWMTGMHQIFKHKTDLHDDWLIFPHSVQFTMMLSNPVQKDQQTQKLLLIVPSLDFAATTNYYTQPLHSAWTLQITGQWQGNIPYGICHSFTPVLDRGTRSSHPWQSYRMSLHHIILLTFES